MAFREAFMWVASGYYDIVLVAGAERQTMLSTPFITSVMTGGVHAYYEAPSGITFPGVFAMLTHLYSKKYGVSLTELKECMAMVAIKAHKNGSLNPKAQFQKEISMEQVLKSFMVAQPLQLFDCCPVSDGAAAAVLASADVARKLVKKPIFVAGVGQASAGSLLGQKELPRVKARELSAKRAYQSAGLSPEDINVCELHDCFTIAEILAIEGLGFFNHGEGYKAVKNGETQIGGRIAINPSGGLKARGHPVGGTGLAQIYEITKQLRGECEARQVERARIGMTDTLGGDLCSVVNIILRR
jgi:acetyl-CoA C-acetyltransferase/acetyl-CoA acyltransferase